MKIYGNAGTGNVYNAPPPNLPRADGRHTPHRPWCVDCKVKHDASELDRDGRCPRCAHAAVARAEADARRTADPAADQVWEQALSEFRGTGRRTPKPKPARTTPNDRVPGTRQPTREKPPAQPRPAAVRRVNHTARINRLAQRRDKLAAEVGRLGREIAQLRREHGTEQTTTTTQPGAVRRTPDGPRAPRGDKLDLPAQQIIAAYAAGATMGELAAQHDCTAPTIRRLLLEHGAPTRDKRVNYTPELLERVRAAYVDQELSKVQAAEHLGVTPKVIERALRLAAVTPRPAVARNPRDGATHVKQQLVDLGVTSRQVKVWALEQGLVDELRRGIPKAALVAAYAAAHHAEEAATR